MEQTIYSQLPQSDFIASKGSYSQNELEKLKDSLIGKPVKNEIGHIIGEIMETDLKDGKLFVVCKMNDNSFYKTCLISN